MSDPSPLGRLRDALPVVVGPAPRLVHAPEHELDFLADLQLVGVELDDLQMDAGAVDVDDRDDRRRIRRRVEKVEGVGDDFADLVREADLVEGVLREAGLADALSRELDRLTLSTLLPEEGEVVVALAEEDRGREAGIRTRLPLLRLQSPGVDVVVVAGDDPAAGEIPLHAAPLARLLDLGRDLGSSPEARRVGAVAEVDDEKNFGNFDCGSIVNQQETIVKQVRL